MNVDVARLLQALGLRYEPKGARLWSVCPHPDHDDHDPSWFIWGDGDVKRNGWFRCYGCGWSGNAVDLVEVLLGIDHEEAREWLASGEFDVPLLDVSLVHLPTSVRAPVAIPDEAVFDTFDRWPAVPRRYLLRRGFDDALVARWGLGYATRGRLRGRIVLPARDHRGALVGYQARTFLGGDHIRYLHPPGARPIVYGSHLWGERRDRVVVVEGPFDAIAVDAATRMPVAALLGSEVHPRQLISLARFDRVTVMTDDDDAGDKAWHELQALARHVRVLERVRVPDGDDPGSAPRSLLQALLQ